MARSHISIWALVYAWECVLVCVCIWYLCRYITGKKKSLFNSVVFFIWLENRLRKKAKTAHTIMRCPRAYTQNHCIIIDAVPVCIMLLFHTWSFSFVFLLLIKLTWMLCFHICCCLLALFSTLQIDIHTYYAIFFLPINFVSDRIYSLPFSIVFFFPFKVSRLLPQTACL